MLAVLFCEYGWEKRYLVWIKLGEDQSGVCDRSHLSVRMLVQMSCSRFLCNRKQPEFDCLGKQRKLFFSPSVAHFALASAQASCSSWAEHRPPCTPSIRLQYSRLVKAYLF